MNSASFAFNSLNPVFALELILTLIAAVGAFVWYRHVSIQYLPWS